MKIVHPKLNSVIEFHEQSITSIVVEDKGLFEELIIDFANQIDKKSEIFIYSIDDKPCSMEKYFQLICSPLDIQYTDKRLQKNLLRILSEDIETGDIIIRLSELYSDISSLLGELQLKSEYNIDFQNDFIVTEILKNFSVSLEAPDGSFVEKFIDYGANMHKLVGKNIFILANCDAFIGEEGYKHIEKWAKYEGVSVIFLRNRQLDLPIEQNEYIIDIDFCEIH